MNNETIFYVILIVWVYMYIFHSMKNKKCLEERSLYFYNTPRYFKEVKEYNIFIIILLTLFNFLLSPFYYLSLIVMVGLRKLVDTIIWNKKMNDIEEKLKEMEEIENKKKKKKKNVKRLN